MTQAQIRWASTHDWFIKANKDNSVTVRHDMPDGEPLVFNDYQELKDWAGY